MSDRGAPEELFHGTAWYYARYRPPYPDAAIDAIAERFPLAGRHVIDLGCGTGEVARPLAQRGALVRAIDPAQEMLDQGRDEARRAGVTGINWLRGDDQTFETVLPSQRYGLCTIGAAFHWMDRDRVLATLDRVIEPQGGVVVLANAVSTWTEDADWAEVCREVIVQYLGPERRAGSGTYNDPQEHHATVLQRSVFSNVEVRDFDTPMQLSVEDVIGLQLSYSYASPALLGERLDAFCKTLPKRLLALSPSGRFEWTMKTELIVATR